MGLGWIMLPQEGPKAKLPEPAALISLTMSKLSTLNSQGSEGTSSSRAFPLISYLQSHYTTESVPSTTSMPGSSSCSLSFQQISDCQENVEGFVGWGLVTIPPGGTLEDQAPERAAATVVPELLSLLRATFGQPPKGKESLVRLGLITVAPGRSQSRTPKAEVPTSRDCSPRSATTAFQQTLISLAMSKLSTLASQRSEDSSSSRSFPLVSHRQSHNTKTATVFAMVQSWANSQRVSTSDLHAMPQQLKQWDLP